MEELQDAIEDAQYMNEITNHEEGPRPVLAWEIPTEEQLTAWKQETNKNDPEAYSLNWTLQSAIGLFLFSSYIKEARNDYCRINFCEEVIRWKKLGRIERIEKAKEIIATFFYRTEEPAPKREIDEHDLERHTTNADEIEELFSENYFVENEKSYIGLDGTIRNNIINKMQEIEKARGLFREKDKEKAELVAPLEAAKESSKDNEHNCEGPCLKATNNNTSQEGANEELNVDLSASINSARINTEKDSLYFSNHFFDKAEAIVMHSIYNDYWADFLLAEHYVKLMNFLWYQDRRVVPEDFFVMRVLGRGGFGSVTACKKGTSGKLYAMKVMNKRRIKMKKSEQLALNEQVALAAVESPFVVNLKYSFHSKDDVYLILDLMTGGDLGYHLQKKGKFAKKECLYYAARIMLGLQALHDKQYVYRDLKPENCLLAEDGRVKITDLGLATKITPTLHGAAGTRGYWAPEMLRRDKKGKRMPYGHTVDWFSFGCCVAEFISGKNPFRSPAALNFGLEKGKQTKDKAIDCATLEMEPTFDSEVFDDNAADLCQKLLDKNEKTRVGYNGCKEIMEHPWFAALNWEHIKSDLQKPPYIPPTDVNAASQSEIGTFAEDKVYQKTVIEEKDEEVYQNWDWTNSRAFAAEVIEFLIYERKTGEPLVPAPPHGSCCCVIS
mmetsp:Transcript_39220/g.44724  ORF Transcript_39220/g.44724 Transcript_39220/m.44724 type:complete len:668 (+) Transcript_39220:270-2273(+)|eukprot:CAMPEP_0194138038 /NCGR_PEP_ID=MMETSP0152-20130528/7877_1 /TAXON_ID=1049557 /ORGANISM="Thalassiothrix antarctica, Strain L6-D1" /LENGTH=667 /DNA_ID=CAMNT_0038835325 /DNA_START=218 /DNA_END=2224 /DNA_ORIENTATION=-